MDKCIDKEETIMENTTIYKSDMQLQELFSLHEIFANVNLDTDLIAFCEVKLWDGPRYALVNLSERNKTDHLAHIVEPMMRCNSLIDVAIEGKDVVMHEAHHDGTNTYIFRRMRKNKKFESLKNKVDTSCKRLNTKEIINMIKNSTASIASEVKETIYA